MKSSKFLSIVPLLIFGLLIGILVIGLEHGKDGSARKSAPHIGDRAPVTDLLIFRGAGARFTTSSWRGRPYILNFFASWCADCRSEHEELMTLADQGMPMIGVIFKDKPDKAAAYLDRVGNPYTAIALDDDGHANIDWGLEGVPETFLMDANGFIRWHHAGGLTDHIVRDELMPIWENVRGGR